MSASPPAARAPRAATRLPPPLSAATNSRRPMVTVIRPSRVRCVNGTIPRHERVVFTFKEAGCWLLRPQSSASTALLPPPTPPWRPRVSARSRALACPLCSGRRRWRPLGGGGFGGLGGGMGATHSRYGRPGGGVRPDPSYTHGASSDTAVTFVIPGQPQRRRQARRSRRRSTRGGARSRGALEDQRDEPKSTISRGAS